MSQGSYWHSIVKKNCRWDILTALHNTSRHLWSEMHWRLEVIGCLYIGAYLAYFERWLLGSYWLTHWPPAVGMCWGAYSAAPKLVALVAAKRSILPELGHDKMGHLHSQDFRFSRHIQPLPWLWWLTTNNNHNNNIQPLQGYWQCFTSLTNHSSSHRRFRCRSFAH